MYAYVVYMHTYLHIIIKNNSTIHNSNTNDNTNNKHHDDNTHDTHNSNNASNNTYNHDNNDDNDNTHNTYTNDSKLTIRTIRILIMLRFIDNVIIVISHRIIDIVMIDGAGASMLEDAAKPADRAISHEL